MRLEREDGAQRPTDPALAPGRAQTLRCLRPRRASDGSPFRPIGRPLPGLHRPGVSILTLPLPVGSRGHSGSRFRGEQREARSRFEREHGAQRPAAPALGGSLAEGRAQTPRASRPRRASDGPAERHQGCGGRRPAVHRPGVVLLTLPLPVGSRGCSGSRFPGSQREARSRFVRDHGAQRPTDPALGGSLAEGRAQTPPMRPLQEHPGRMAPAAAPKDHGAGRSSAGRRALGAATARWLARRRRGSPSRTTRVGPAADRRCGPECATQGGARRGAVQR